MEGEPDRGGLIIGGENFKSEWLLSHTTHSSRGFTNFKVWEIWQYSEEKPYHKSDFDNLVECNHLIYSLWYLLFSSTSTIDIELFNGQFLIISNENDIMLFDKYITTW